jgi:hypothetical protein
MLLIIKINATGLETRKSDGVGTENLASATGLLWTTHHEQHAHNELLHWVLVEAFWGKKTKEPKQDSLNSIIF